MKATTHHVFVLEDQLEVGGVVCRALEDHGFKTEYFPRAHAFLRRLAVRRPDLCIIDLGLPDEDGLAVIREVQSRAAVPVIILTGRSEPVDRVLGLELGADDYVVKPFDPRELIARVKAVLRRTERAADCRAPARIGIARFGDWTMDFDALRLTTAGGAVSEISAAEAQLLLAFCRAPHRVLTREALLGLRASEDRSPFDRSIDVRVSRLRQKLEVDPKNPQIIRTVYGAGYIFAENVDWTMPPL